MSVFVGFSVFLCLCAGHSSVSASCVFFMFFLVDYVSLRSSFGEQINLININFLFYPYISLCLSCLELDRDKCGGSSSLRTGWMPRVVNEVGKVCKWNCAAGVTIV